MHLLQALPILGSSTLNLSTIESSMTATFGDVKDAVVSMISKSVPFALAIIGTVLAVTIGIKVFKKLTSQA